MHVIFLYETRFVASEKYTLISLRIFQYKDAKLYFLKIPSKNRNVLKMFFYIPIHNLWNQHIPFKINIFSGFRFRNFPCKCNSI